MDEALAFPVQVSLLPAQSPISHVAARGVGLDILAEADHGKARIAAERVVRFLERGNIGSGLFPVSRPEMQEQNLPRRSARSRGRPSASFLKGTRTIRRLWDGAAGRPRAGSCPGRAVHRCRPPGMAGTMTSSWAVASSPETSLLYVPGTAATRCTGRPGRPRSERRLGD